jgi:hypothetical protein
MAKKWRKRQPEPDVVVPEHVIAGVMLLVAGIAGAVVESQELLKRLGFEEVSDAVASQTAA